MLRLSSASLRSYATLLGALGVLSCGEAPTAPRNVESAVILTATPANITAPSLVISQIYGGGGNSGSVYKNDFIEYFNPTASPVSVNGWSVQYGSSGGTTWSVTNLSGSVPAGGYYLVQEAVGAGGTTNLPTPDATGSIAMSATAGKVLLASTTTPQTGACPTTSAVVDIVGFGTGTQMCVPATATLTNTTAALRGNNGCTYSQIPALTADFSSGTPTPRNTASPFNPCGAPPVVPVSVTVAPASISIVAGNTTTFTPTALDASSNPVSTTYTWTSSDVTVATINAAGTATGVAAGTTTITVTTANNLSATAQLTVTAPTIPSHAGEIVVSQIFGGGGNAGSVYKNDYVELFNRTTNPISVDGWSVQYASAAGSFSNVQPISGTIPAGGYYLVAGAAGTGGTTDLPTPDVAGSLSMGGTAGKILVIQSTTAAGSTCPTGNAVVDLVSYGAGTNCGTTTANVSSTTAAFRKSGGCYYTPDVATDFTVATAAPRNSATTPRSCVVGPLDHVNVSGGLTVLVGATTQLTVVALDANDNIVPGAAFTWTSANPSLATVSATGLVTGVSANIDPVTITVSAAANGITKTASADVQVNTDGINWIDVSSSSTSFPPGFQTQVFFTARVQSGGTIIPADFTFEATDPQYMTVQNRNNTAIVTGVATPTDGTRPGIRVTAVPKGGGTPYTFVSRSITIETSVVSPPSIYANNDEFGLPTPATTGSTTDMLIRRPEMTIAYNQDRGTPNWVSYELDARHLVTGADRCNCFTADPLLPLNKQIFTSDYTNGGYDRGHMARSADRTSSNYENATTFYLTNIVPQIGDLNQGVWAQFENQLADSARAGRAVYIITGPLYSRSNLLRYVNDSGKIAIPDSTWKVALIGPGNGGNPFTRANITSWDDLAGLSLLAVNMPNIAGVRNDPPSKYYTTVEKIETATGYDILSLLNAAYQPALDYKDHAPVARFTTSGVATAGAPMTFDATTSSDSDIGRIDLGRTESLTYSWAFSDGSTATGTSVTRTFAQNGDVTATLTVTDAFGWPSTTSSALTLVAVPPQATFAAPSTVAEGSAFTLQLNNATDPSPADQAALRYAFDCGAGYGDLSSSSSASCTRIDNGVVTVRGKVVDPGDAFTEYTATLTVANVPPTATFTAPTSVERGFAFALTFANATDVSTADVAAGFTYAFDCGTGYGAASANVATTCGFTTTGAKTVRGRVIDKDGGASEYTAMVDVTSPILALVRRAPVLNGRIEGNVQQLTGENVTFNGGGAITGRLYVPGLPTVRLNGNPTFGGSVDGIGSTSPAGYTVTLNGNATLGGLARRFDAVSLPTVDAPRNTTGTRSVSLNKATDVVGDWATVKTLTVNGNVGTVAMPAGAYEQITVNGNNTLVLGVAGSTTPAEYDLKRLTLNGNATLQVAGPVILTMSEDLQFNGTIGSAGRPDLLTLRFSQGNVTLNGNATLNAVVVTPNGRVTINSGTMIGALVADGLTLNGNAVLKIVASVPMP